MRDDVIISVDRVSKKFAKDLKKSLMYGVSDMLRFGRQEGGDVSLRNSEFLAVNDVSFELKRGEALGLIGHNGAGKSTLLKMINGIIRPDKGSITIRGKVGALIELGAGFNPILTGRENIFNNGAVLGFSKREMESRLEEIIDFSEIRSNIDMPVQNYSSGMKVRLGFAIASNLNPDLLLVDEVLAVGDVGFKIKCFTKIAEMMNNCTIIFVSHSMPQVTKISTKVMLMDKGEIVFLGDDTNKGVQLYYDMFQKEGSSQFGDGAELHDVVLANQKGVLAKDDKYAYLDDLIITTSFTIAQSTERLRMSLIFFDKDLKQVAVCSSQMIPVVKGLKKTLTMKLKEQSFSLGRYSIAITFNTHDAEGNLLERLTQFRSVAEFSSQGLPFHTSASFTLNGEWTS